MSTEAQLRRLIERQVEIEGPDEPLQLESRQLVVLADAIEETFGLRIGAADVVPENFGTLSRLVAFVDRSRTA